MTAGVQKKDIPEESVPMRVICCLLAVIAISCSFVFGKTPVPVIDFSAMDLAINIISIWLCIGGCMFSFHYRHDFPRQLQIGLKVAAVAILLNLARELWIANMHSQQFECLYPLVNALTATSIVSCFELRTRKDIIATSSFGLTLMALAGCSGRSILFGGCVLLYIMLGAVLLCLCARSYAMGLSGADARFVQSTTRGHYLPALLLSVFILPCASLAAFSFMPRADALADQLATQVRSLVTSFIYQHAVSRQKDMRLPLADPNRKAAKRKTPKPPEPTESEKQEQAKRDKEKRDKEKQDRENAAKQKSQDDTGKQNKNGRPKDMPWPLAPAEKETNAGKAGQPKAQSAKPVGHPAPPADRSPLPAVHSNRMSTGSPNPGRSSNLGGGGAPSESAVAHNTHEPGKGKSSGAGGKGHGNSVNNPPVESGATDIPDLSVPENPATSPPATNDEKLTHSPPGAGKSGQQSAGSGAEDHGTSKSKSKSNSNSKSKSTTGAPNPLDPHATAQAATGAGSTAAPPPEESAAGSPAKESASDPGKNGSSPAPPVGKSVPGVSAADSMTGISSDSSVSLDRPLMKSERPLFTLACNRSVYVKLVCLDSFDGRSWHRTDAAETWPIPPDQRGVDLRQCPLLGISAALPVMELTENFELKADLGEFVPTAGVPQHLSLLNSVLVDRFGNVMSDPSLKPGAKYTAICDLPAVSVQQMRETASYADTDDRFVERYLVLPPNQSEDVIDLAQDLSRSGTNRFTQAENIVAYLRKNCTYTDQAMAGDDKPNLADEFLFKTKKGDCKAFATGFVVLCRAAGIPSRFVAGFLPGDADPVSGASSVKVKHAHAWAEIYMEPYGWISFDATPGGLLPARPEQKYYNYNEVKRDLEENANTSAGQIMSKVEAVLQYAGYAVLVLFAIGILVGCYFIARVIADIRRELRKTRRFKHPAMRFRKRVMKSLHKLGVTRQPSDTGRDILAKLEEALASVDTKADPDDLQASVEEFFETYDAVLFGKSDAIPRLRAITMSIERQVK